ncbi:MAG: exosortase B [Burkholderiales bacterium]
MLPATLAIRSWHWLPLALGLAVLYLPTFYGLNRTLWNEDEHAHGPLILLVVLWLFWKLRQDFFSAADRPATVPGALALGFGLLLYVIGRSQSIVLFEVGSLIPVLAGLVLLTKGAEALRRLWFPLLFIVFMVPLPFIVTDALTGPLKRQVSMIAEYLLYAAGYPIARDGVILIVGQYQLHVADACSGLNSMFSLSAIGLLYLYLMQHRSRWRNALLIASILPIAFAANIVRVVILILITYHLGDAAGQGFAHGFAGMVLFVIALLLLFAFDSVLGALFFRRKLA